MDEFTSEQEKQAYEQQYERFLWACELVERYLNPQDKVCLDIGCGVGNMILALKKYGARKVIGIDIDLSFMGSTFMEKIAEKEGIDLSNCWRVEGEVGKYQFDDEYFDLITMYDTLEHVANPTDLLSAACGILRPEGTFFISSAPLYYSPIGHHVFWSMYSREKCPWVHLTDPNFAEKVMLQNAWCGRAYQELNKLTLAEIMAIVEGLDLVILRKDIIRVKETLDNHPEKEKILNSVKNEDDLYIEGIHLLTQTPSYSTIINNYKAIQEELWITQQRLQAIETSRTWQIGQKLAYSWPGRALRHLISRLSR